MPILFDFKCNCGHQEIDCLIETGEIVKCSKCGKDMEIMFNKAPNYHMDIETWIGHERGHLDSKINKSMRREQARKRVVEARQRASHNSGVTRIDK